MSTTRVHHILWGWQISMHKWQVHYTLQMYTVTFPANSIFAAAANDSATAPAAADSECGSRRLMLR